MTGARRWVLLLVGTTFLSGLGAGVLLGLTLVPDPPSSRPYAAYEARLVRTFGLEADPLRVEGLRAVLAAYHEDVEALRAQQLTAIEHDLADLGLTCRRRIRDKVLPPDRRDEFDRLALGLPGPAPR